MYFYRISYAYRCEDIEAHTSLDILCSSQGPIDRGQVVEWLYGDVIRAVPLEAEMRLAEIDVHEFTTGEADYRMMF